MDALEPWKGWGKGTFKPNARIMNMRDTGIEPVSSGWKPDVLPFN